MKSKIIPSGLVKNTAKECVQAQRQAEIQRKRIVRKSQKTLQEREKLKQLKYLQQRLADVDDINGEIADWIHELQTLLEYTLAAEHAISFNDLRIRETFPVMETPLKLLVTSPLPEFQKPLFFPQWLMQLLPCLEQQYIKALKKAESNYEIAKQKHETIESNRQLSIEHLKANYGWNKHTFILEIKKLNAELDELKTAYQDGEQAVVVFYNEMVLDRSAYPSLEDFQYLSYRDENKVAFPQQFQVDYISEDKQLVIDYELPDLKIIPTIAEFRYDRSKDQIYGIPRTLVEIEDLYQNIVAAITLRTISEVFAADQGQHLDIVVFNGFVQKLDFKTKKHTQCNLISVQVNKDTFSSLNLSNIDKISCLQNLGVQVSSHLSEMQPAQPNSEREIDPIGIRFDSYLPPKS